MIVMSMVMLPIIAGLILPYLELDRIKRNIYTVLFATITSIISFYVISNNINLDFTIIKLTNIFTIGFKNDGLTKVFTMIIATLWPLATLYATEYMEHEENKDSFFRYYLLAYGITIGVAFSKNLITMYLFYELLTFLTLPLIMHNLNDKKALFAGKFYLILSILGASIALMGIIIYSVNVGNVEFIYGGLINNKANNVLYIAYILCFIGFGVKAAIVPFTLWLPICGVAPTPVSALLHAVAVVKAGVFAIMRVTHYSYGAAVLNNTFAQKVVMIIAIVTIFYGSIMAVKERNIKRRLAYSTASNLSYILFAVTLMTVEGFAAGMTHMIFHAIVKINLFFAAGSILIYANAVNVDDIKGLAKKMPVTMFAFLIASLALIGIPLTCGFISKYLILSAAIKNDSFMAFAGIAAIIISAILTTVYLFQIIIPAYLPNKDFNIKDLNSVNEAGLAIKIVLTFITFLIIYFGVNSTSLLNFVELVAKGV